MKFPRIYADEQGETHIGVRDVPEHEARVGPPPNPVGQMTETEAVSTFVVFSAPAGTENVTRLLTASRSVIRPIGFGGGPKGASCSGRSRTLMCVSPCSSA